MIEKEINDYFNFLKTKVAILKHKVDAYCLSLNATREELMASFVQSAITNEMSIEIGNDKEQLHKVELSLQDNDRHQLGLCYVVYESLIHYIEVKNLIGTFESYDSLNDALNNVNNRSINKHNKSNAMRKYANIRVANDPKQKALDEIKSHYDVARHQFKRRGYTAKFVKEMAALFPIIESIKTIERFVAKLNKINKYPVC